jgi:hypothetical protein
MQQEMEEGQQNPLHALFENPVVRSAKIYVRASDLLTEAVTDAMVSQIDPEQEPVGTESTEDIISAEIVENDELPDTPPWE